MSNASTRRRHRRSFRSRNRCAFQGRQPASPSRQRLATGGLAARQRHQTATGPASEEESAKSG